MTPKVRQILYTVGVVVFAALTVASTFKVIDPDTAQSVSAALTSILGLFGVTVAGTAAYNTNKQRKDGTFDPAPEVSPEEAVVNGIEQVLKNRESAQDAVERVKDAVTAAVKDRVDDIPVLGPLSAQILDQILK